MELSRREVLRGAAGATAALAFGACSDDEPEGAPTTTATTDTDSRASSTTSAPGEPNARYVPPAEAEGEWATVGATSAGWSAAGLERLEDLAGSNSSTTLVLLSGGRMVVEHYFGDASRETIQDIASCQKSVISTLVGIGRDRGVLGLDDPVSEYLEPGWSNAARSDEARITLRHLLTMSSGLHPRTLRKVAEPGETFEYNTDAYQKLRRVLEAATDTAIDPLTRSWLFDAIDVDPGSGWQLRLGQDAVDAVGDPQWGLRLRARDMARFGLLAQRDGVWGEERLVPEGWFAEAWTPNEVANDYGYLWWLLGRRRAQGRGPEAPEDWVGALGAGDQKIYVIPSLDVVLTRQGTAANEETEAGSSFDRELINALLAARA